MRPCRSPIAAQYTDGPQKDAVIRARSRLGPTLVVGMLAALFPLGADADADPSTSGGSTSTTGRSASTLLPVTSSG